jgi:hypothetical protein
VESSNGTATAGVRKTLPSVEELLTGRTEITNSSTNATRDARKIDGEESDENSEDDKSDPEGRFFLKDKLCQLGLGDVSATTT